MTKYGRQRDRRSRKEAKGAAGNATGGTYVEPRKEECDVDELQYLPTTTTRITTHLRYKDGRLVYYAMMHDVFAKGEWREVTRIDCAHGSAHQHFFDFDGEQRGSPLVHSALHSQQDVDNSWDNSYSKIMDNVESNEKRWRHG